MSDELPGPAGSGAGTPQPLESQRESSGPLVRILLAIVVLSTIAWLWTFRDQLNMETLAAREAEFRQLRQQSPVTVYGVAFVVYVTVTGLSLPGAAGMSLLIGWLLGFWRGLLLVSFASTTGACLAFLLSRYLLRDWVQQRFGERLALLNRAFQQDGAYYLLTLRLIPAVPFFVINLVMALTPIRLWTFWWVSQLGMLPGTAVYIYAGASVPDLQTLAIQGATGVLTPRVIGAFILLGLFPWLIRFVHSRFLGGMASKTSGAMAAEPKEERSRRLSITPAAAKLLSADDDSSKEAPDPD